MHVIGEDASKTHTVQLVESRGKIAPEGLGLSICIEVLQANFVLVICNLKLSSHAELGYWIPGVLLVFCTVRSPLI
jgi:hypothetical protein